MTVTEFRRRRANRGRLVMVRDTHVTVHTEDAGYAWIEASPAEARA